MRLGIDIERIEPGHPEQNGRHERMHLTLKQDSTRPPANSMLQQQEKFDAFRTVFNTERPHEALAMKTPSEVYTPSETPLPDTMPAPEYPLSDLTCRVSQSGHVHVPNTGAVYVGTAFSRQCVGLREIDAGTWLVSFLELDIGYLDAETRRIVDLPNAQTQTAP